MGGANVKFQVQSLREHRPQILVATPGRLAEIVFGLEKLRLGMVRALVIDEVDNLLREPYESEMRTILDSLPMFKRSSSLSADSGGRLKQEFESLTIHEEHANFLSHPNSSTAAPSDKFRRRMVCLASATSDAPAVTAFAEQYCTRDADPSGYVRVEVPSAAKLPASITHALVSVPRVKALGTLKRILMSKPTVECALVFVNDPHRVEVICEQLQEQGLVAAPLHGESSKDDRKVICLSVCLHFPSHKSDHACRKSFTLAIHRGLKLG